MRKSTTKYFGKLSLIHLSVLLIVLVGISVSVWYFVFRDNEGNNNNNSIIRSRPILRRNRDTTTPNNNQVNNQVINTPTKVYEFQPRTNTNPPNNNTPNTNTPNNQPRIPNIDWSNLLTNTIPSNNQSSNSSTRPGFNIITRS